MQRFQGHLEFKGSADIDAGELLHVLWKISACPQRYVFPRLRRWPNMDYNGIVDLVQWMRGSVFAGLIRHVNGCKNVAFLKSRSSARKYRQPLLPRDSSSQGQSHTVPQVMAAITDPLNSCAPPKLVWFIHPIKKSLSSDIAAREIPIISHNPACWP